MTARKRNKRTNDLHARDYLAASRNPQTIAGIHRKLEVGGSISKHEGLVLFTRIADLEGKLSAYQLGDEGLHGFEETLKPWTTGGYRGDGCGCKFAAVHEVKCVKHCGGHGIPGPWPLPFEGSSGDE